MAGLAVLLAGIGVEVWFCYRTDRAARRALARLEAEKSERDRLSRQAPALTEEYEQAVRAQIEAASGALAELRPRFGTAEAANPDATPAKPVDAYFEISAFVERMRTEAARARISVRSDERFGFATFASEGPQPDLVAAVTRQCGEVQQLMELLLRAQPGALLAVQRERPLTTTERAQRLPLPGPGPAPATQTRYDGPATEDFFDFNRNLSIRRSGIMDTDAFRLEFTGRTSNLRQFLNQLAESPDPVAVRSIEVEPFQTGMRESSQSDSMATAPVPVVSPHLSRFTVIVEMLLLPPQEGRSES